MEQIVDIGHIHIAWDNCNQPFTLQCSLEVIQKSCWPSKMAAKRSSFCCWDETTSLICRVTSRLGLYLTVCAKPVIVVFRANSTSTLLKHLRSENHVESLSPSPVSGFVSLLPKAAGCLWCQRCCVCYSPACPWCGSSTWPCDCLCICVSAWARAASLFYKSLS